MTRKNIRELLPAMTFWAAGGTLCWYDETKSEWNTYKSDNLHFDQPSALSYIMLDEHFETRKAFALGKKIEFKTVGDEKWRDCLRPSWMLAPHRYRVAKPEWFEIEANKGKVFMMRDSEFDDWMPSIFTDYVPDDDFKFKAPCNSFKYARPLTGDEIGIVK